MNAVAITNQLFELYHELGSGDYIGEPVSQIEHMSQAAELALQEGYDDEVVLAAFFHDIGHLCVAKNSENDMNGLGVKNHEKVGADYLRALGYPEKVAYLVEAHVKAKRYLCFKYHDYLNKLSESSKATLQLQGGIMTAAEAIQFESHPHFLLAIKMREWDDLAKVKHRPVTNVDFLKQISINVLKSLGLKLGMII